MRSIRRKRSFAGSAIAETGPALFILIVMIFFPCVTILGLGAQYAFGWYHNHLIVEELAQRKAADGGLTTAPSKTGSTVNPPQVLVSEVGKQLHNGFDSTGMAAFIGVTSIEDTVTYFAKDDTGAAPTLDRVECKSIINGKPFICIPFLGFTKVSFGVASEATREVTQ